LFTNNPHAKHAAIIVKGGKIMSWGINQSRFYNIGRVSMTSACAECTTIRMYKKVYNRNISNRAVMYITARNIQKLSRPCSQCVHVIKKSGLRLIWYTSPKGWIKLNTNNLKVIHINKLKNNAPDKMKHLYCT